MYDFESSDTDYSYEYSDVEYNTLDPYDYELNNFKTERDVEVTPEEKLLQFLDCGDLEGVKVILPGLLKFEDEVKICNGDKSVSESGDAPSDYSGDEEEDFEEDLIEQLQIAKVKELFLKGGDTPLMIAASSALPTIVEYILSLGVDVNYCMTNSNKCALLALTSNICVGWRYINNTWRLEAPKCLKLLIDAGANVRVKGFLTTQESGYTALHYAALSNYWEMLELLINAGADVDAMSNQRETALMIAASKGFVACCNILLLAGANAQLTDRSGNNAAYLAGIEGHKILSDSICVFSGSAQHNVELYKIWSHYTMKDSESGRNSNSNLEITDNISNTCIQSFCLALDAPELVTIMQDQGLTISDLKFMSSDQLKEIGVSENYCDKIMVAMRDFNKRMDSKDSKFSFEYGRPLKIVSILEIVGNISEHIELIDTNLESWYAHLSKKYQRDSVLRKTTIHRLQSASLMAVNRVQTVLERLQQLKDICDKKGDRSVAKVEEVVTVPLDDRWMTAVGKVGQVTLMGALSLVAVTVGLAFISRRSR